ncbi:MAG TPA: DUF4892 domain-containing protein, partial [Ignavibacteria bacterium]|nr:DUF4892 domain-containing protein [Ignavibacteria bacterium]
MKNLFIIFAFIITAVLSPDLLAKDASGSKDHPLLSRYKGAEIIKYNAIDYDEYALGISPVKNGKIETKSLEGKITTIIYKLDKKLSTFQVFKNYESALKRHGFKKTFTCTNKNCGDYFPKKLVIGTNREITYNPVDVYNMKPTSDFRYLSGSFEKQGKLIHVSLLISKNKYNNQVFVAQDIVESTEMQQGLITIDLKSLDQAISQTGKATLHGLNFESNSAQLTSESSKAVEIIAKYLKQNAESSYFVVGHTDNNGEYAFNLKLSEDRAKMIKKSLQAKGIPGNKLVAV